jgi:Replication initiator protein, pSAM2
VASRSTTASGPPARASSSPAAISALRTGRNRRSTALGQHHLLRDAAHAAVSNPAASLPDPRDPGSTITLAWGPQADARIVRSGIEGERDDHKVAAYVSKYAVKGTEQIGGIPVRIRSLADLDDWHVTGHVRKLITACWQLGQRPEYQSLRLAPWAHQLGYSGWFSTRSRRYSVTLGSRRDQRRQARTAWIRQQHGLPAQPGVITAEWNYSGQAGPAGP